MAYRDDISALEARVEALSTEVAERERERDDAARMLAEARERAHAESVMADLAAGGPAKRRRRRIRIATAFAVAMLLGGGITFFALRDSRPDRVAQAMKQFDAFADEMCLCKDATCVESVAGKMNAWSKDHLTDFEPRDKLDKEQLARGKAIAQRMSDCLNHVH